MFNIDSTYMETVISLDTNLVLTKSGGVETVISVIILETGAMLMHKLRMCMTKIDLRLIFPEKAHGKMKVTSQYKNLYRRVMNNMVNLRAKNKK